MLGRRGPAQAAYTTPELRELGEMQDADVFVDPADVELDAASAGVAARRRGRPHRARQHARSCATTRRAPPHGHGRRIVLRFLRSPVEILGEAERVEGVRVVRNELIADDGGNIRAHHTEDDEVIDCSLVLRSVGYRGVGIEGLPFDERSGTIVNDDGPRPDRGRRRATARRLHRRLDQARPVRRDRHEQEVRPRDRAAPARRPRRGRLLAAAASGAADLDALLAERGATLVDYAAWERIDEHERAAGEAQGRPRVKLTRREELLERGAAAP